MKILGITIAVVGTVIAILLCTMGLKLTITAMLIAAFVALGIAIIPSPSDDVDFL